MAVFDWINHDLEVLHRAQWHRSAKEIPPHFLQFGSNNYLGLAQDPRLKAAAIEAIAVYGTGATGSRLVSGHLSVHRELEQALAGLKGTEDALVFSSGYLANVGTIVAVVGKRDLILADARNHACLHQGALLSGAQILNFRHKDVEHLDSLLAQHRSNYRRCLITTNTVFSMEGDVAPLSPIEQLAQHYGAMVMVDEAHGTGVFGQRGSGVVEAAALTLPLIQTGTLSKAIGSLGGFVAGSRALIDYLRNRASTWIYTTGLSPADAAAALAGIALIQGEPQRRDRLWQNVAYLRARLGTSGMDYGSVATPIVPLWVGDVLQTQRLCHALGEREIFVPAIRPPTVPKAQLRISLMATHTPAMIDRLVAGLVDHFPIV